MKFFNDLNVMFDCCVDFNFEKDLIKNGNYINETDQYHSLQSVIENYNQNATLLVSNAQTAAEQFSYKNVIPKLLKTLEVNQ